MSWKQFLFTTVEQRDSEWESYMINGKGIYPPILYDEGDENGRNFWKVNSFFQIRPSIYHLKKN